MCEHGRKCDSNKLMKKGAQKHSTSELPSQLHFSDKRVVTLHLHTLWKMEVFLLFCDRMTVSLSTRRFEWISVHFGILLVLMTTTTTFRVYSYHSVHLKRMSWILGGEWEQTECLHTHISTECPFYSLLKDAFFHNFFLQLPISPSTDSPFSLLLLLLLLQQFFFLSHSRFSLFCAVSLSISILLFSFHPRPAIQKVHHSTTHFIFFYFFGSRTNK